MWYRGALGKKINVTDMLISKRVPAGRIRDTKSAGISLSGHENCSHVKPIPPFSYYLLPSVLCCL
jgi:hypothetical protein